MSEHVTTISDRTKSQISNLLHKASTFIEVDSSIYYTKRAMKLAQGSRDRASIIMVQGQLFSALINHAKYVHLKQYLEQNLQLGRELTDSHIICKSLIHLANLNWVLSDLAETLIQLEEALEYAEKAQSLEMKAEIINSFGMLYGEMGDPEKASYHFNQCLIIAKKINSIEKQAVALNNLTRVSMRQGKFQNALSYAEQMEPLMDSLKAINRLHYEFLMATKGEALIKSGQLKPGLLYLDSALQMAKINDHPRAIIDFSKTKAIALFDIQAYDKTISTAKEGARISKKIGYFKDLPKLCEVIANSYKMKSDFKNAFLWKEEERKASEEYEKIKQGEEVIRLQNKTALQQIALENQRLALKNKDQKIWTILISTLGTVFSLFVFYFIKKQHLQKMSLFRKTIVADLHDSMGFNLNSITRIAKELKNDSPSEKLITSIDGLIKHSDAATRDVFDVIWAFENHENDLEDLIEKIEVYLDHLKANNKSVKVDFIKNNLEEHHNLKINVKYHLLMVFKEAMNNIQKHTDALVISVTMSIRKSELILRIFNQFEKRKADASSSGRGIPNIKKRIHDLGGTVMIKEGQNNFDLIISLKGI